MSLHGLLHFLFARTGAQVEPGIERIHLEEVAVRLSHWRARAVVADLAEVIAALERAVGELVVLGCAFWKATDVGRQIEQYPVRPGAGRSIRIVCDQGDTLGSRGQILPGQFR